MHTRIALVVVVSAWLTARGVPAEEPLFPFVISYDAPENVTNVSDWLERPAGKHGFVPRRGGW